MRIIVSMTSWYGRIDNVATVIKSILNQTTKPDLVELNLSLEEFINKEEDLPEDLLELIKDNKIIEINWCEENNWTFKKIIPTLKKFYGEDYYLVSIDDDYLYAENFIEKTLEILLKKELDAFNFSSCAILGNREIYRASIFTPDFWEDLKPEDIATRNDDGYIYYYLKYIKNAKFLCREYVEGPKLLTEYNPKFPNSLAVRYFGFDKAYEVFSKNRKRNDES